MKKNIEWLKQWIEEYESEVIKVIEKRKDEPDGFITTLSRGKQSAIKRIKQKINQLDEPEVPVVPEKVYEYITQKKRDMYTIQQVFYQVHWNYKNESMAEEEEWVSGNEEEFAKAWLAYPNIEVEKEPLYYVMKDGVVILSKRYRDYDSHESHWIGTVTNKEYIKENPDKVRFTEQEIKDFDERFWSFAVPVEDEADER